MKKLKPILTGAMLIATSLLLAQTSSYTPFPASQTIQSTQWHQIPGCACGIDPSYDPPFRKAITVNPTSVTAKVGQSVQIRYDASYICNGQGIHDVNGVDISQPNFGGVGTIQWEAGAVQTLPSTYGIVTFSGYSQPKTDTIHVKIDLACYDAGAKCTDSGHARRCPKSVDIPVTVK